MEIGTVLSVAQTLIAVLNSQELKDTCSMFGYESQLADLQHTVNTVKAVLLDAETKELNPEAQLYIEELKDAVYDADDVFDRFITLGKQKQLIKGGKATKKLRRFFSRYNPLGFAYTMSQGVKKVRKKLDAIANNHAQFGFSIDPQPMRLRREETCSYVYEGNIVGREDDVNNIVGNFLNDSNTEDDVSFLTIVGIGGLGKTALAQLVYNDSRVKNIFPTRIWTCISDHDQEQLDVEATLRKILSSITGDKNYQGLTKESLQFQIRETLTSKKFLLVLDDVWSESRNHWLKLVEFLLGGQKGSWIVVTTRSHETARIIGTSSIKHELKGLSMEDSWYLFNKIAFGLEQSNLHDDFVKIGREIVEGCVGVPLAIRVAGSLLYGQEKSKWLSFQKIGLSNSSETQKDIMPILKLSYHQLESPLKSCFTYCALFPKDYVINKEKLIRLWMAQGYIVPLDDGQTLEDVAEEYFTILLRRCFFQDIKYNRYGEVFVFKIHDLMHDIAQKVTRKEICVRNFVFYDTKEKARHLCFTSRQVAIRSFTKTHIRSCLFARTSFGDSNMDLSTLDALLSNWTCLRALDLHNLVIRSLPESIGEMLHIRYLDLSNNGELEVLPKSIIKLYNLQTLIIGMCMTLKELPKDLIMLVNLRILEITLCNIGYLTCLGTLPHLKTLRLDALLELEYMFEKDNASASITTSMSDGLYIAEGLLSFLSLEELHLKHLPNFEGWRKSRAAVVGNKPNNSTIPLLLPQLKSLYIFGCPKIKSNLLCPNLERLSALSIEENLQVNRLTKEQGNEKGEASSIPKLSTSSSYSSSYGIPKLRRLETMSVRWLKSMPLESFQCAEKLAIFDRELENLGEAEEVFRSCSSSLVYLKICRGFRLRSAMCEGFKYLTALETLKISDCPYVSLSEEEEKEERGDRNAMTWPSFHHTLRHLSLDRLPNLKYLPNWMQFLVNLQTLEVIKCESLEAMPAWLPKLTSLRHLRIEECSETLKERCQKSIGEDWPLVQHIPSVYVER